MAPLEPAETCETPLWVENHTLCVDKGCTPPGWLHRPVPGATRSQPTVGFFMPAIQNKHSVKDKPLPLPSKEVLRQLFSYNPETGLLTWRKRTSSRNYAGKEAGTPHVAGYRVVMVNGVRYLTHRLIWKLVTGKDPVEIDHVDGNRANNRLINLRAVTRAENSKNMKRSERNSSGVTGVYFSNRLGKYIAEITAGGKYYYLGLFYTAEAAVAARKAAELELNFHKNHGRVTPAPVGG